MVDPTRQRDLWPHHVAREAAWFAFVAFVVVDGLLILTRSGPAGSGALFNGWSVIKHAVTVAGIVWLWTKTRESAMVGLALLVGVVGIEEVIEITAEIGKVVAELLGVGTGELGVNSQAIGRLLVATVAGGPAVFLAMRAQGWLRKALYTLLGLLGVLFVVAVGVDALFDQADRNIDEGLEEPIVSAMSAFTIGLVVEYRRRSHVAGDVRRPRKRARR